MLERLPIVDESGIGIWGWLIETPTGWRREGVRFPVLGMPAVAQAARDDTELHIYGTPWRWLSACRNANDMVGACIVAWDQPDVLWEALAAVAVISCEYVEDSLRLEGVLERCRRAIGPRVRALHHFELEVD